MGRLFIAWKTSRGEFWAIKKPARKPGRLISLERLLLLGSFFQHTQSALVSFVSSLLSFLSSSQSFVSFAVSLVSTSLGASGRIFNCSYASFDFFGVAAASCQNGSQSDSGQLEYVVHVFPLKVDFP